MIKLGKTLTILPLMILVVAATAACGGLDNPPAPTDTPPGSTTGAEDNTFDHDNSGFNPFDLIDRLAKQGPPRFSSRVHSCAKVRYKTLGNVLTSLGVNLADATPLSAGELYTNGTNALGAPNYANRIRENIGITTSGASKEFDIFAAAADTIITAVPTLARCQVAGVGAQIFDPETNACRTDGIACLTGVPAQAAHLEFCNITVSSASDVATGKRLAVAALLAAAYTCE
jgi:hypothetical protein